MRNVSNSQQSIGQLIDNFETAVKILELVPDYTPNEPELSVAYLQDYVLQMKKAQVEVEIQHNAYSKALDIRDEVFYAPINGLVDVVDEAKNYIIGVFKFNSPEFRHVRAIHFRKFKRRKK